MDDRIASRRQFLRTGLGVLAGAAAPGAWLETAPAHAAPAEETEREGRPPNLIVVFADQWRACSTGCYGNAEISTPHIDGLAAHGARFVHAVATTPLSSPYRACLMTGRYPSRTGVVENQRKLPGREIGLAEVMNQFGYRTGFIGKWFLDGPTPVPPEDPGWVRPIGRQGFQRWIGFNAGHVYYGGHYYLNRDPSLRTIPAGQYEPDFQTSHAMSFVAHNRQRPFCLVMSIGTPHPQNVGSDLPPGGDYVYPYDPGSLTLRPNVDYPSPNLVRQEYADYYGIVSNLDWNVGRLLRELRRLHLERNTILVVTSDHGDYLGSHYSTVGRLRGKRVIYAESLDVPLIVYYPQAVPPMVVPDVFTSVDIMPTLLGLCNLPVPSRVMGRDFSPVLRGTGDPVEPPWGPVPATESALVGMFGGTWVGVRTSEYSLECERASLAPTHLFHNTQDPYQLVNCVDDPAYQPVRDALRDQLQAWMDYVG
jgi:arylsulfatase A-like enzyme